MECTLVLDQVFDRRFRNMAVQFLQVEQRGLSHV